MMADIVQIFYPYMPIGMVVGIYRLLFFFSLFVRKFFVTDISGVG